MTRRGIVFPSHPIVSNPKSLVVSQNVEGHKACTRHEAVVKANSRILGKCAHFCSSNHVHKLDAWFGKGVNKETVCDWTTE